MDSEVFARIRDYLAEQLEVEPEKITPDSDIVNDFGADSLDVIDMITTLSDEFGRKTAAELVQDCGARVFPVGRLDMDSEGLLLFTNDGELMQRLIHPKFEVDKLYRVTVRGDWEKGTALLRQMRSLEGEVIAPAQVELVSGESEQAVLHITIHQGKNRQIRRMCKQAGLTVLRLERLAEHGILLGTLPCGKWRALTDFEVRKLKGSDENDP